MSSEENIVVFVKPPLGERFTVSVSLDTPVLALKTLIQTRTSIDPSIQRLVYAGHIMKDEDALTAYGITSQSQVNLVCIAQNKAAEQAATSSAASGGAQTASSFTSPFGIGNPTSQQPLQNPEMLNSLMNNPMMQSLMDNPEFMRSMMMANPQMQQLAEQNPEINHLLSDPAHLRQMMDAMRNPAAMREMQRNQDRALANIEMLPGGMSALQRMYSSVQSPLQDALGPHRDMQAEEAANRRMAQQLNVSQAPVGQPNNQPLPNPWAPPASTPSPASVMAETPSSTMTGMPMNFDAMQSMMSAMMGQGMFPGVDQQQQLQQLQQQQFSAVPPAWWSMMGLDDANSMPSNLAVPSLTDPLPLSENTTTPSTLAERYANQIEMMVDMGFERDKALRALGLTGGNVDAAVNWLLRDA